MTHGRVVLEVARWEFHRFFKMRQQIVSLVLTLTVAGVSYALAQWVRGGGPPSVATVNAPPGFSVPPATGVRLVDAGARVEADMRRDVAARALDGALVFADPDHVTVIVRGSPAWIGPLADAVTSARREQRLRNAMEPAMLAQLFGRVAVRVEQVGGTQAAARTNRVSAIIAGALMMMGIWVGLAYMFVGITGEKQTRITEQVVSAISPQGWMDGKILGLSLVAAATTAGYVVSALVLVTGARLAGLAVPLPTAFAAPAIVVVMVLLAVLAFAFWITFIAAIAALINDPHSSNRGGFIMLPLAPVVIAMMAVGRPDAFPIRLLSLLPPTASPIMLTRLVVGQVAWWEEVVAIALLVGAIWMMRLAAGRIFRTSLLLYGKEPSWSEVWRWLCAE